MSTQNNSSNFYEENLRTISGIKFTRRQVDVMSCLISGWDVKSIALRLSIAPSTVETHLDAITQKLGSGGRNSILTFVEQSGQENQLRVYYEKCFADRDSAEKKKQYFSSHLPPSFLFKKMASNHFRKRFLFALILFSLLILGVLFLVEKKPFQKDLNIRSDLVLPHKSSLLERSDLLNEIDVRLEGSEKIKAVVILGIGGAGKTTLARQYARNQKSSVIWEINAETKETLINSFEDLARNLAQNREDKEDIALLREIKGAEEREKNLFLIVKKLLKENKNWLFIYDNVESFDQIKKYLPSNPDVWGQGKIIMTTRDENIKNATFLDARSFVFIKSLSPREKYSLFTSILHDNTETESRLMTEKEVSVLLQSLPSFPLDIVTAANYIKDTRIDYQIYLQRIYDQEVDLHMKCNALIE